MNWNPSENFIHDYEVVTENGLTLAVAELVKYGWEWVVYDSKGYEIGTGRERTLEAAKKAAERSYWVHEGISLN